MRRNSNDYRTLFVNDTPLMDVRAPVEFSRGAFPTSSNIPLLDDDQREQIGIRYNNAGQDEAVRLGLELATPELRARRLRDWCEFCEQNPGGYIYCFRGGLRSRTTQQWLRERGIDYPLVEGGYKAMRRYLIDELARLVREIPLICVSGLTGAGKTRVLRRLTYHLDFEGLANHRGSAFGRDPLDRQPSNIDWENAVAIGLIKHAENHPRRPLFVEDEGRMIGRVSMPDCLYEALLEAPRAVLQRSTGERVRMIGDDYILRNWPAYRTAYGDAAETEFARFVLDNLARIKKRLGGERYGEVRQCFESALERFFGDGDSAQFDRGIRVLLEAYYDPMYRYQMQTKRPEIIFEGPENEFVQWAEGYCNRGT